MSDIIPMISSGTTGPLGVLHLPRLWLKASLGAAGKLHSECVSTLSAICSATSLVYPGQFYRCADCHVYAGVQRMDPICVFSFSGIRNCDGHAGNAGRYAF